MFSFTNMQDYKAVLELDRYYHIYNRANGNDKLFLNDDNYQYFLKKFTFYISPIANIFAYCLMPNHFHFIVRIKGNEELRTLQGFETLEGLVQSKKISQQFSHLFNSYSQAYNKQNTRKGSLFIPRFNRKPITTKSYLKNTINYIHQNPVYHKYVSELEEWKYSSYNSFLNTETNHLCSQETIDLFGDLDNFIYYHQLKKAEQLAKELSLEC